MVTMKSRDNKLLHKAITARNRCSSAIIRATSEPDILQEVCRLVVVEADYRLAWIGLIDQDDGHIKPAAHAGVEEGYLATMRIHPEDPVLGKGPSGSAVRLGRTMGCADILTDPDYIPWRENALKRGYASSLATPLLEGEQVIGVFNVYATEPHAFGEQARILLEGIAHDLSFAILKLRLVAQKQEIERNLIESEERYRALTHSLRDGVVVFDINGVIQFVNRSGERILGYGEEELIGRPIHHLITDHQGKQDWLERCRASHGSDQMDAVCAMEGVVRRKNGAMLPVDISLSYWQRLDGLYFTAAIHDISQRKQLEARDQRAYVSRIAISALLEVSLEPLNLQRKLEVALDIILTVPWLAVQYKGSIFLVNGANELEMVVEKGLHPHLRVACRQLPFGYCLCGQAALTRQVVFTNALDANHTITYPGIQSHGHYCVPILLKDQLLGVLNIYVDHGHAYNPEEEAFLTTIAKSLASVIDRGILEERISFMATHDRLTGLVNKAMFMELLAKELQHAYRIRQTLAVVFLDLDHFKEVNDTLGHEAGDRVLQSIANEMRVCFRESDTLGRLGGDEFGGILAGIGDGANAVMTCEKLLQLLAQSQKGALLDERLGISIGISLYPLHGQTGQELLNKADEAMYAVKKRGRNGICVYSDAMNVP